MNRKFLIMYMYVPYQTKIKIIWKKKTTSIWKNISYKFLFSFKFIDYVHK